MITIEAKNENNVEMKISKNSPHIEILLGIEMLVEAVVKETKMNIDDVLEDIKRIYLRDNGGNNNEKNEKMDS